MASSSVRSARVRPARSPASVPSSSCSSRVPDGRDRSRLCALVMRRRTGSAEPGRALVAARRAQVGPFERADEPVSSPVYAITSHCYWCAGSAGAIPRQSGLRRTLDGARTGGFTAARDRRRCPASTAASMRPVLRRSATYSRKVEDAAEREHAARLIATSAGRRASSCSGPLPRRSRPFR